MSFSFVDIIILLFVILGGIIGYKQGMIKTLTHFVGLFVIIIISFILKDKLMVVLYENLPFFEFFGFIRGIQAINILFYQLVSFLIIFAAFMFVLKVLLVVTGLVEYLVKMTIFLSLPSKILGIVVGALEYYVYVFIALLVLNIPVFNLSFINNSNLGKTILEKTPVLSSLTNNTVNVYTDVWNIIKNKKDKNNSEINTLVLATLLDNDLISIDSAKKLVKSNKIYIKDPSILNKYEEGNSFYDKIKEVYNFND